MLRKFMSRIRNPINIIGILLIFIPFMAYGLNSDKNQIANITSDHAKYNHQNHVTEYSGNINYCQGSTKITADKVIVYDNGHNKIYKIIAVGNKHRAHYSTLTDAKEYRLNAKADIITYYPEKGMAIFEKRGEISQHENKITGPYILYNINQQTISVISSKKNKSLIVLQP